MKKLSDLIEELNACREIRDLFADYKDSSSYICDAILERADSLIDIYNCDLIEWAKMHIGDIDEAADELGKPDSFIGYIQQGQFIYYEHILYDNLEDGILWAAYNELEEAGIEEITEEQKQEIEDFCSGLDNNNRFEDIKEVLDLIK